MPYANTLYIYLHYVNEQFKVLSSRVKSFGEITSQNLYPYVFIQTNGQN